MRDNINELGAIEPPEYKNVGGYYIQHKGNSNLKEVVLDSIYQFQSINEDKYLYFTSNNIISDSTELVKVLTKMNNAKLSPPFFLNILPIDTSIDSSKYQKLWRIQYDFCMNNKLKPVFVFTLDSLLWQKYGNNLFPNAKGAWNETENVLKISFFMYLNIWGKNHQKVTKKGLKVLIE